MIDARDNTLSKYASTLTDFRLIELYKDWVSFKKYGIMATTSELWKFGHELCSLVNASNDMLIEFATQFTLEEIGRRYVNLVQADNDLLKPGDDIYYVDKDEMKIEHGKVSLPVYKNGSLDSFSVNFDDGDFDEFVGSSYETSFFKSKKIAEYILTGKFSV